MNKQKGFSAVIILLSLVLIVAVGFTGYYVWNTQNNKEDNKAEVAPATTTKQETKQDAPSPVKEEQKYLVIKEWGIVLIGIETKFIGYEIYSQNTAKFIVPAEKKVSSDCKNLGIGIERAKNRNELPLINENNVVYNEGYYYSIGGSPGACNDNPDSYDYKTNWSAIDYMSNQLKSYKIERAD